MEDIYDMDSCIFMLTGGGNGGKDTVRKSKITNETKTEIMNQMIYYGWDPSFLSRFFTHFHYTMTKGRSIQLFINDLVNTYITRANLKAIPKFYNVFVHLGLRPEIINEIIYVCEPLLDDSYTYEQLIDVGVEYVLQKHIHHSITDTHLFPDHINDTWYLLEMKNVYRCMNLSQSISTSKKLHNKILSYLKLLPVNQTTHDFHFHATSWSASVSIMNELNHAFGRPCLDFGIKAGFYISQTLHDALDLGYKRSRFFHNEVAIVVFLIPKHLPETIKYKHLMGEEWSYVTKKSRLCIQSILELPEINAYDLLYGNMVANPEEIKHGANPVHHTIPKTQLVSKRIQGDMFLQSNLVGCIYFKKDSGSGSGSFIRHV